jgi:hypothetical protein
MSNTHLLSLSQESEETASSPDLTSNAAVVGSPDDAAWRTQAWLKESVDDTFSDSENETEESLLSEVSYFLDLSSFNELGNFIRCY